MIAKISRGTSIKGLANYLHGPGKANEHSYDGKTGGAQIGGNVGVEGDTTGGWADEVQEAIDLRPDIDKPVWHMSLRAAPGDPVLTDETWRDIAQSMGEQMGWSEQPWAMVRHADDHVHIAVSRVNYEGKVWNLYRDYLRAQEARVVVEREFALTQAPVRQRGPQVPVTSGEHSRALASAKTPPREVLADKVRAALEACQDQGLGRVELEALLREQKVLARANVASTGRVSGYSFSLEGHLDGVGEQVWFKGSQLDRELSWTQMGPRLNPPPREVAVERPPRRFLEPPAKHRVRVEQVEKQAVVDDLTQRRLAARQAAQRPPKPRPTGQPQRSWYERALTSERRVLPLRRKRLGVKPRRGQKALIPWRTFPKPLHAARVVMKVLGL